MKKAYSLISIILLFSACSIHSLPQYKNVTINSDQNISSTPQKLLTRVAEYWHYRLYNDYEHAYEYELPYQRYLVPLKAYRGLIDGYGKNAKIEIISIKFPNPYTAIVQRRIKTSKAILFSKDKWVNVDGEWYHKFFQNILPPKNKEEQEFQ